MLECKKCGCRDVEKLSGESLKIGPAKIPAPPYRCRHCHFSFFSTEPFNGKPIQPLAIYLRTPCPVCGSNDTIQQPSGPKPNAAGVLVRRHRCNKCKVNFRSQDVLK